MVPVNEHFFNPISKNDLIDMGKSIVLKESRENYGKIILILDRRLSPGMRKN